MGSFFYVSCFSACIVYDEREFKTFKSKVSLRVGKKEHTPTLTVMQGGKSDKINMEHTQEGKWITGELCLTEPKKFITNETSTQCKDSTNTPMISDVKIENALVCEECQGTVSCSQRL